MSTKKDKFSKKDKKYMKIALDLAKSKHGLTGSNPSVGCVIVKDDEIIAKGWHDHIGGLHAEQMAIADAEDKGISLQGATAYITSEIFDFIIISVHGGVNP